MTKLSKYYINYDPNDKRIIFMGSAGDDPWINDRKRFHKDNFSCYLTKFTDGSFHITSYYHHNCRKLL